MTFSDLLWLLLAAAIIWYWLDSMRVNELARQIGRNACDKAQVLFLDDTVALNKIRLKRNSNGQMSIYRQYQFEFTSDGERRYRGQLALLGRRLLSLEMEAYRDPEQYDYH